MISEDITAIWCAIVKPLNAGNVSLTANITDEKKGITVLLL
jgi:hypothetical protein